MGGKGSGRRPIRDEEKRNAVIDKAWEITKRYLEDPSITDKEKMETACKIIVRDMPEKLTGGQGEPLNPPTVIFEINKNAGTVRAIERSDTGLHAPEGTASPIPSSEV